MRLNVTIPVICLALAIAPAALAQHDHGSGHEGHAGMAKSADPAQGVSAWTELKSVRAAIAKLIETGKLAEVHNQAERLAPLGEALTVGAKGLADDKRVRLEATLRQLAGLGKSLDKAGDAGDSAASSRELKRLDGVIALIEAQYPADLLPTVPAPAAKPAEHGSHAHKVRPLAAVDDAPKATLVVKSGEFKFEPKQLTMSAGVPTRIELDNEGVIDHALIVVAPDGKGDWIHLHAMAKASDSGTFKIDHPGTYPVLCTVAGHTEAGMVGELVVR
jgi:plastocyanin